MNSVLTIGLNPNLTRQLLIEGINNDFNLQSQTHFLIDDVDTHPNLVVINEPENVNIVCQVLNLKRTHDCSIIVVTSNSDRTHRIELIWAGANECINAPYQPLELIHQVKMLLKQYQD